MFFKFNVSSSWLSNSPNQLYEHRLYHPSEPVSKLTYVKINIFIYYHTYKTASIYVLSISDISYINCILSRQTHVTEPGPNSLESYYIMKLPLVSKWFAYNKHIFKGAAWYKWHGKEVEPEGISCSICFRWLSLLQFLKLS